MVTADKAAWAALMLYRLLDDEQLRASCIETAGQLKTASPDRSERLTYHGMELQEQYVSCSPEVQQYAKALGLLCQGVVLSEDRDYLVRNGVPDRLISVVETRVGEALDSILTAAV